MADSRVKLERVGSRNGMYVQISDAVRYAKALTTGTATT